MIYADLAPSVVLPEIGRSAHDRTLTNIRDGCPCLVSEAKTTFDCYALTADGSLVARHAHNDPAPGCVRVVLSRRPRDGEHGPFGYDPKTQEPIPHAENTRRAKVAALDAAALDKLRLLQRRAALLRAGKPAAALAVVDAEVATVDARIAAAIGALDGPTP